MRQTSAGESHPQPHLDRTLHHASMDDTLPRLAREIDARRGPSGAMQSLLDTVPCDICGSTSSTLVFRKRETRSWWLQKCADDPRLDRDHEFAIVRCADCRHVFVNPRLKPAVNDDIYARYWRSHEPAKLGLSAYGDYVCRQLSALGGAGRLLDFGCGWGSVLNAARAAGWTATGIEVDERKVAFCNERGLDAVYGDLLDRPFAEGSFDAAIAEQVFEHLYAPVAYMKELHRVLAPGGLLYVAVPNFGGVAAKLRRADWEYVHPASHVRYFDRNSLADLAQRCGFEVLQPTYVSRRAGTLANAAYAVKTFSERNLRYYPSGLALYLRKR
jgi:SAM-dependent methyltransferase